jgi:hypothetical protein
MQPLRSASLSREQAGKRQSRSKVQAEDTEPIPFVLQGTPSLLKRKVNQGEASAVVAVLC